MNSISRIFSDLNYSNIFNFFIILTRSQFNINLKCQQKAVSLVDSDTVHTFKIISTSEKTHIHLMELTVWKYMMMWYQDKTYLKLGMHFRGKKSSFKKNELFFYWFWPLITLTMVVRENILHFMIVHWDTLLSIQMHHLLWITCSAT